MMARLFAAAMFLVVGSAVTARAQEDWRGERHEHMHWLRRACEAGDERACWRLREMHEAWRERQDWRERQEWRERRDWREQGFQGEYGQQ
jgi:TPR repeat protein